MKKERVLITGAGVGVGAESPPPQDIRKTNVKRANK